MTEPIFGPHEKLTGTEGANEVQDPIILSGVKSTLADVQAALEAHSYPKATDEERNTIYNSFLPFIQLIQGNAELDETIDMFAQLYFHDKNYEMIYKLYEKLHMDALSEAEMDDAYDFFLDTFPNLEHDEYGNLVLLSPPSTK